MSKHSPTEIKLHQKSRILEVAFADGQRFHLPCEYLRVFSRAAESRTATLPEVGKERVNISKIAPQGHYALRVHFDDGHDTSIYSWDTLYELGLNQVSHWQDYLQRLAAMGYQRQDDAHPLTVTQSVQVSLLYFAQLAKYRGRTQETVQLPAQARKVSGLLAWLREQHPEQARWFADDTVQITVNKQFAEPFTPLETGDEVALVPKGR